MLLSAGHLRKIAGKKFERKFHLITIHNGPKYVKFTVELVMPRFNTCFVFKETDNNQHILMMIYQIISDYSQGRY